MAANLVNQDQEITVAELPTGSGKTFIAGLLAKYYVNKGNKVAVVTCNTFLVTQMKKMLGAVG